MPQAKVSRRRFLKSAALTGSAAVMPGASRREVEAQATITVRTAKLTGRAIAESDRP